MMIINDDNNDDDDDDDDGNAHIWLVGTMTDRQTRCVISTNRPRC